jgi:hypothetical protein
MLITLSAKCMAVTMSSIKYQASSIAPFKAAFLFLPPERVKPI